MLRQYSKSLSGFLLSSLCLFWLACAPPSPIHPGCETCPSLCLLSPGEKSGHCVACFRDEDCQNKRTPTSVCTKNNQCVCASDSDCTKGHYCLREKCLECRRDVDCPDTKPVCNQKGSCVSCRLGQSQLCKVKGACRSGQQLCNDNETWGSCEGSVACNRCEFCQDNRCLPAPECVTITAINGEGSIRPVNSRTLSPILKTYYEKKRQELQKGSQRFIRTWRLKGTNLDKVLRLELRNKYNSKQTFPLLILRGDESMLNVQLPRNLIAGLFILTAYMGSSTSSALAEIFVLQGEILRCKSNEDCSPGTCNTKSGLCVGPGGKNGVNGRHGTNGTSCSILSTSQTTGGATRVTFGCGGNRHSIDIPKGSRGEVGKPGDNGTSCQLKSQKTTPQKNTELLFQCGLRTNKVIVYRGPRGDKGDKGDTGKALKVDHVGPFKNIATLSSPSIGETFLVHDNSHVKHNHLFVYNGNNFIDAGRLAGVPGPSGTACKIYATRLNSTGDREITFQCGTQRQSLTIPKGPTGPIGNKGATGQQGPIGNTGNSCFINSTNITSSSQTRIIFQCGQQKREVLVERGIKGEKGDKGDVLPPVTATYLKNLQRFLHINDNKKSLIFTGANVHIVNGLGRTGSINGFGNLQIGYNANSSRRSLKKNGSHNLILGDQNDYHSYAGIVAGFENTISGPYATIVGGRYNISSGEAACVSGGDFNTASGYYSSVTGGTYNTAIAHLSHISGGKDNTTNGQYSSIVGGEDNITFNKNNVVVGGYNNQTNGDHSVCLGGSNCKVKKQYEVK